MCKNCRKERVLNYKKANYEKLQEQWKRSRKKYTPVRKVQPIQKVCTKCDVEQPIDNYYYDKSYERYCSQCKTCKQQYQSSNRDIANSSRRLRMTNPHHKIRASLSTRISKALGRKKTHLTMELIGCSIDFLKKWFEFQFPAYMSFDNYGTVWHIDHYMPCNSFDLSCIDQQFECFHWTNLRPMGCKQNIMKKDNILPHTKLFIELKTKVFTEETFATNSVPKGSEGSGENSEKS